MIDIKIIDNSPHASVTYTKNNISSSKKILLKDLFGFFSTVTPAAKDTGYIAPSLIRELIKDNVSKRVYYMKECTVDVSLKASRFRLRSISTNPHNITLESANSDYPLLKIPQFTFRDVLGHIHNNMSSSFNSISYEIGFVVPDIAGRVTDSCAFEKVLNNHYDRGAICWPSNLDTSVFLNSKDTYIQSSFITQYLTSRFNSDLDRGRIDTRKSAQYQEGFYNFLRTLNTSEIPNTLTDFKSMASDLFQHIDIRYLFHFYVSTILKLNPLTVFEIRDGRTLGRALSV